MVNATIKVMVIQLLRLINGQWLGWLLAMITAYGWYAEGWLLLMVNDGNLVDPAPWKLEKNNYQWIMKVTGYNYDRGWGWLLVMVITIGELRSLLLVNG